MIVFINIGSNLGNRRLNISRAIRAVEKEFGYFELSHIFESKAQGFDSDNLFLNVGMMFHSNLSPEEILKKLKEIEISISASSHRNAEGGYIDREIDIDIIAIDNIIIDTPELRIPHPRMHERTFVLEPMRELAPFWKHPLLNQTPEEMIEKLK